MTELLAPGVYVQETSFRAKPLEGVSTTTAAFVGPTRRGPISSGDELAGETPATPEILTSIGDFERVYGATDPLELASGTSVNYIAHAVRAYFDNGGQRLYVARVHQAGEGDGVAASAWRVGDDISTPRARFIARQPGAYGDGQVSITASVSPAAATSMARAPQGTVVQTGGDSVATPASATGGLPPFRLTNNAQLEVTGSAAATVVFQGARNEATGDTDIVDPVPLDGTTNAVTVTVDGVARTIALPDVATPVAEVERIINDDLRHASVRLDGLRLVFSSDTEGSDSSIVVSANTALGFGTEIIGVPSGPSNVANLDRVTAAEIEALVTAVNPNLEVAVSPATGALILRTTATGAAATMAFGGGDTASVAMGFAAPVPGQDGATRAYFVRRGAQYVDATDTPIPASPAGGVQFITMNVTVTDADGASQSFENVAFDPAHPRYIGYLLAEAPTRAVDRLENGFAFQTVGDLTGLQIRQGLLAGGTTNVISLSGGNDGAEPPPVRYTQAFRVLESLEDISTIAAPGASSMSQYAAIREAMITHVEPARRRYRMAVLDVPPDSTIGAMRTDRSQFDSTHVAVYGPWVFVANPDQQPGNESIPREILVPPSGFVCGIYARNDIQRGVYKAPANEPVRGIVRLERNIDLGQQEVLNPDGINVIRFFPGRGIRLWGARLASSDPEWNYVNLRRYFNYVKATIDRGTQWAVFEPNGPTLWRRVRETITSFLQGEWATGALLGTTPQEAFSVRCDRSTMTQRDLDTGRLVCEIGIAVVRPAEFVVFRIGQSTAQTRG